LEQELQQTKIELEAQKQINRLRKGSVEIQLEEIDKKEKEYIKTYQEDFTGSEKLKREHNSLQKECMINLYKKMVKSIIPIDLKVFSKRFLRLRNITNFSSLDHLLEKINENQKILDEVYSLSSYGKSLVTFPYKIKAFLDHLQNITRQFREFF